MNWISVSDRLPDDNRDVLTYSGDEHYPFGIAYYCHRREKWLSSDESSIHPLTDLTHWCKLEKPKA